jgi:calcineurin-like phosphoesterase family protein
MDNRCFSGYEEMNEFMIAQWNKKVTARDDVYILGDFCISKGDAATRILDRLSGKKHLIVGNHDKYLVLCQELAQNKMRKTHRDEVTA